jgi:hypothetical protein
LTLPNTALVTMAVSAINASTAEPAAAWLPNASAVLNINPPTAFSNGHVYYIGGTYEAS